MLGVAVSAVLLTLGGLVPAAATEPAESGEDVCVQEAVDRALEVWTCLGGTLSYYEESADGQDDLEVVSEIVAPTEVIETSPGAQVSPLSLSDPDNYWCEQGTICTSRQSSYISKTKGNVAWGNTQGLSGSFDIVIYSNLNGRSSRGQVKIFRDLGASLKFTNLAIECVHAGNAFGCGSKFADKEDGIVSVSSSWLGPVVQGNKLTQQGTYNDKVTGRVTPTGAPVLPLPTLSGLAFKCPSGTGNCTFP